MVCFPGSWVEESFGKRRPTGGRAGAVVHQCFRGSSAEMLVVSVLHLSLNKPVLKTFDRVKVQKRNLKPFSGTSTCNMKVLNEKFLDWLSKFGVRRNSKGRPIRCNMKVNVSAVPSLSASTLKASRSPRSPRSARGKGASQEMVTPTKEKIKTLFKCFSETKAASGQSRLSRGGKMLDVVFKSAEDMKDDDTTYRAAMAAKRLQVSEWKPVGKPRIVDANGTIYQGKPRRLDSVHFPLVVTMRLTEAAA
mmetsp:Transcript_33223/g.59640  ORF Transcript_33223/g.59640 Transcript_33223/m.59640 type:complete len:249 (+) Transcript_33223:740-1486(+)